MSAVLLTFAAFAIPASLIAAIVRRWLAPVSWGVVSLFFFLTVLFLGKAVTTSDVPVPLDGPMLGYPYKGVVGGVHPRNTLTNDTVHQMLPWMKVVREELGHSRLPLWNSFQFSGYPLLANGQSAPLSPLFLLTLVSPLPKQLVAMAALKIFLSLLFGFLLCRREGLSEGASIAAALVYGLSVFQTVYLYYPVTAVTSLLPMLLCAMLWTLDSRRTAAAALLAVTTAAILAGGHPESAFHAAAAAAVFLSIEWIAPNRERPSLAALGTIAIAVIAGAVVAAPAWLPVVEQALQSDRITRLAGASPVRYAGAVAYSLLSPNAYGNPARGTWRWFYNYSMVAPTYVGIIALSLAMAAPLASRARRDVVLWCAGLLMLLIAFNWTVLGHAINTTFPFALVANDKLRFVYVLIVAVLVGRALDRLPRNWAVSLASAIIMAGAASWLLHRNVGAAMETVDAIGVAAAIVFWIVVFFLVRAGHSARIPAIAAILIACELFTFNHGFNTLVSDRYYVPRLPIIDRLHAIAGAEPYRATGFDWVLPPNAACQYGIEDIRGSDPMATAAYTRFLATFTVTEPESDIRRVQDVHASALSFLNVRFLLVEPGQAPDAPWVRRYEGPDGGIYENPEARPRFFVPQRVEPLPANAAALSTRNLATTALVESDNDVIFGNDARILDVARISPVRWEANVRAEKRSLIASSLPFSAGWILTVNNVRHPITRINGAFIGLVVPPGTSAIRLIYHPRSFWGGVWASLCAAVLFLFWCWRRSTAERKAEPSRAV
jgi:hypothetical protein